ncbi:MAG: HAMP domain-containing protein [Burkholderiales bacterium]|nr:HAMP domain-containing protein [Burkholderiales bacterium]
MKRWFTLSLRKTLMLGAGLGILLPALVLSYLQVISKMDSEIEVRLRQPMQQQADVLSRGLAAAIWNVDKDYASDLIAAVLRNPDVVSVTVTDEYQNEFARQGKTPREGGSLLIEQRDIVQNGIRVGRLMLVLTTARIHSERIGDLGRMALALVAQVAISFAVIWWLFNVRFLRPLITLQNGAQRLARGDLDKPLQWRREDEMGSLAQVLDAMRSKLATLIAERDQKNADLLAQLEERKAIEAALQLSQAQFESIFNASPVAISVSHLGEDQRIADVNGAWLALFARTRDSVVGTSGLDNATWRDPSDRKLLHETVQREGRIRRFTAWMQRGEGQSDMLCEISGRVLAFGGDRLLILSYDDITQKQRNEAEIVQLNATLEQRVLDRTQELRTALDQLTTAKDELVRSEKLSALGALVAGIAHELNTPIGNSLTVASTLQDHTRRFTAEAEKGITRSRLNDFVRNTTQGAEILMSSLQHAASLVASFKQVAVDQTSVNRRRFGLHATVAEILMTLGPTLRKTSHTVQTQIPADIVLDSFPGPFGQIVTNLVQNALIHAFEGQDNGLITIAARRKGDDWVEITVQDNGRGIPPEHLGRIFDPFFTTKFGKGGSGLGLNIVYNLASTALGGRIRVDSPPGQGACFTLELPLNLPDTGD